MLTASALLIRKTLHRVFHYKRSVAYWQAQEKELSSSSHTAGGNQAGKPSLSGLLTDYEMFAARTLDSYCADLNIGGIAEGKTLLQRCLSLLREELTAEADRLCDAYGTSLGDEAAFMNKLCDIATAAVARLAASVTAPQAQAA